MKTLKLKRVLLSFMTIWAIALIVTSCQQESVINTDDIREINKEQNDYVFEALKPLDNIQARKGKKEATYFERNEEAFKDVMLKQPQSLKINIPLSSESLELKLEKWNIFADDFAPEDRDSNILPVEKTGIFYNGTIKGDPNSNVAVSIFENELSVTIMRPEQTHILEREEELMRFYKVTSNQSDLDETHHHHDHNHHGHHHHTETDAPKVEIELEHQEDLLNNRAGCTYNPVRVRYTMDYSFVRYFNNSYSQARQYLLTRFNEVKSIYNQRGIPLVLYSHVRYLPYNNRLRSSGSNVLGSMYSNFASRFGQESSNYWDINAVVVAVNTAGGTSGTLMGGGYGNTNQCSGTAPICKTGAGLTASNGCRPIIIAGLSELSNNPDNAYFTYSLAHEIGHNFGINQEFNNVSGGLMDHYYYNHPSYNGTYPLYITYNAYVSMYYNWVECYYTCN